MRFLELAKELGVPYEHLTAWCRSQGQQACNPEDEASPEICAALRRAFSRPRKPDRDSMDNLDSMDNWLDDEDLNLEDYPQSLEDLEALEKSLFPKVGSKKPASGAPDARIDLQSFLKKWGLEGKALLKRIRRLLPEHLARLLNHENITMEQAEVLGKALTERLFLCCGNPKCEGLLRGEAPEGAVVKTSNPAKCKACEGSTARRGLKEMAALFQEKGLRRLLIVGGSPDTHKELKDKSPPGIDLRLIEGENSRDKRSAAADLKWCDVVVIWGGTILGHEVSQNYVRAAKSGSCRLVAANRRSVEALCEAVVSSLREGKKP